MTGFSDEEESMVGLIDQVPFSLESRLKALGGVYSSVPAFGVHVVVSGRLVTGQNPASSKSVAARIIELLNQT